MGSRELLDGRLGISSLDSGFAHISSRHQREIPTHTEYCHNTARNRSSGARLDTIIMARTLHRHRVIGSPTDFHPREGMVVSRWSTIHYQKIHCSFSSQKAEMPSWATEKRRSSGEARLSDARAFHGATHAISSGASFRDSRDTMRMPAFAIIVILSAEATRWRRQQYHSFIPRWRCDFSI